MESICLACGEHVLVDITPGGAARVEPPDAVISLVNPRSPRFDGWRNSRDWGGLAGREPERAAGPGVRVRGLDATRLAVLGRADVSGVLVQILQVPDCPLVGQVRETVRRALASARVPAVIEELTGEYVSPTVLVDGMDVTGRPAGSGSACRLDLPTEQQIVTVLQRRHVDPREEERRGAPQ